MLSLSESDIKNAGTIAKQEVGIDFAEIRKIYYSVFVETMNTDELQALSGKATFEAAWDFLTYKMDSLGENYYLAWEKFGIILRVV
jgi:hypothetical protein